MERLHKDCFNPPPRQAAAEMARHSTVTVLFRCFNPPPRQAAAEMGNPNDKDASRPSFNPPPRQAAAEMKMTPGAMVSNVVSIRRRGKPRRKYRACMPPAGSYMFQSAAAASRGGNNTICRTPPVIVVSIRRRGKPRRKSRSRRPRPGRSHCFNPPPRQAAAEIPIRRVRPRSSTFQSAAAASRGGNRGC